MRFQSAIFVLDPHVAFMQAPGFKWSKVDVPGSVVELFQADVPVGTDDGDIDPVRIPADAAVDADIAELDAVRIFKWR